MRENTGVKFLDLYIICDDPIVKCSKVAGMAAEVLIFLVCVCDGQ